MNENRMVAVYTEHNHTFYYGPFDSDLKATA